MEITLSTDLYASQMGALGVSIGILRALVERGVLQPVDAADILRDAAATLPAADGADWKAVQRQTYEAAARHFDHRQDVRAAA